MRFPAFKIKKQSAAAQGLFMALLAAVFVMLPLAVFGQVSTGIEIMTSTGLGAVSLPVLIVKILRIALGFLGIVAVIIIMYGGYIYMTAAGQEDKIEKAKKIIINGVIGLAIMLASFAIASYVLGRLTGVINGTDNNNNDNNQNGFNINDGVLGGGIIESVYPDKGATDVPRNTLIMVAFKEPMNTATIINTDNTSGCPADLDPSEICGILQVEGGSPNVRIVNKSDNNATLDAGQVIAMTTDHMNYVFRPVPLLGSANGYSDYDVVLSGNLEKADHSRAFAVGDFSWFFQVSNVVDLAPPQIVSVFPVASSTVPMNAVIQIDFNEAINAASAAGHASTTDGQLDADTFNNLTVTYLDASGATRYVSGSFVISNRFRTVTFLSDSQCLDSNGLPAQNSCGETPRCLPVTTQLSVLANTLSDQNNPLSGVSDAAGNGLDGDRDGSYEGRPADNYAWWFATSNTLDLTPPVITAIEPESDPQPLDSLGVPRDVIVRATFNERLSANTVNSNNFKIFRTDSGCYTSPGFPGPLECYPHGGFSVYRESDSDVDIAALRTYSPNLDGLTTYNPRLTSSIKDIYQNCFRPADGP